MGISKSQVDKLGTRLRDDTASNSDYELLEDYRRDFAEAFAMMTERVVSATGLTPTGRPSKSLQSIIAKLKRETTKLSQMQDIAGCRLIVSGLDQQDYVVGKLVEEFPAARVVDRRESPSSGYRAVHVVVSIEGKNLEIQVRTSLQDKWAQLVEELAFKSDPGLKYGTGNPEGQKLLYGLSEGVAYVECLAANRYAQIPADNPSLPIFDGWEKKTDGDPNLGLEAFEVWLDILTDAVR